MHGKSNHLDIGMLGDDFLRCVDPALLRHKYVHYNNIRQQCVREFDNLFPVAGFADNLQVGFAIQQCSQFLPCDRMVVRQKDAFIVSGFAAASCVFYDGLLPAILLRQ